MQIIDSQIIVSENFTALKQFLNENNYSQVVILVDENTNEYCIPLLEDAIENEAVIIDFEPGESSKNLSTCVQIWSNMLDAQVDRKALFINVGGGVVCDMGGFVATTFKRGIDFINIPTSLMAQVDAAIGGKLGVDFEHHKNTIGLFRQPKSVFINPIFLKTLPIDELKSGFAEMLKHALILDRELWKQLSGIHDFERENWLPHITKAIEVKKYIVENDFTENSLRKTLNFGHTIGHAIESYYLENEVPILHGYAVAAGIICETYISHKLAGLSYDEMMNVVQYTNRVYPKLNVRKLNWETISRYLHQDKKNFGNQINCTLLPQIGKASIDNKIDEEIIKEALFYYGNL